MIIGSINNIKIDSSDLIVDTKDSFQIDEVVGNALLLTLAGYLEKDDITINGEQYFNKKRLEQFFSYILNDKRAAPRKYDLQLDFSNKKQDAISAKKNNYKYIISFSGGVDSSAGLLYALDKGYSVQPVWIGFGQKNEKDELEVINRICKKLKTKPTIIKINLKKYVDEGWNRWKMGIIPGRNYIFASIAASMANLSSSDKNTIYICAHKEEINPVNTDKSKRFYNTCTEVFTESYKKDIKLTTPFFDATKPEIIYYWIKNWEKKYGISPEDTVSCYHGTNCGTCKACINRAVAFACSGLPAEGYKHNPFEDTEHIIQEGYIDRFGTLKPERKLDFLFALNFNKNSLPTNLRKFVDKNYKKYSKKIIDRQKTIRKGLNIK